MKKYFSLLICSILTLSFLTMSGCEKKDKISMQNKQKIEKLTPSKSQNKNIEVNLYFDSASDNKKVDLSKEERLINTDELLGELIIHELIKGPSINSKLNPVVPKDTRLLSFSINNKIAYVNLSKEVLNNMSPNREITCVKSIIWSLTSLSGIDKVTILIENKNIKTLAGNLDLSKPLGRSDFDTAKNK